MPSYTQYRRALDFSESKHPRNPDNGQFVARNGEKYDIEELDVPTGNIINVRYKGQKVGGADFKVKDGFVTGRSFEIDDPHKGIGIGGEVVRRLESYGKLKFETTNEGFWTHMGYSKKADNLWTKDD